MKNYPNINKPVEEVSLLLVLKDIRDVLREKIPVENRYYDNSDLKRMLNLSDSTLYRMRKNKVIPYKKISGKIFYPKSYFDKAFKI